jgi:hypothetical protein
MHLHICVINELDVTHVDDAGHYLFYRRNDGIVKTCYIYHLAWNREMRALDVIRFGATAIAQSLSAPEAQRAT